MDCSLFVSAGVDSATDFSQSNQENILTKDNSPLTECVMALMLIIKSSRKLRIYLNPCQTHFYELAEATYEGLNLKSP